MKMKFENSELQLMPENNKEKEFCFGLMIAVVNDDEGPDGFSPDKRWFCSAGKKEIN